MRTPPGSGLRQSSYNFMKKCHESCIYSISFPPNGAVGSLWFYTTPGDASPSRAGEVSVEGRGRTCESKDGAKKANDKFEPKN